jgi:prepilin-type N-terminal cleavage/methylation domain-containing protein
MLLQKGFTLAEVLVALSILTVIATFNINKTLTISRQQQYSAMAKEAATTISEAYLRYKQDNVVSTSFNANLLAPYLNYVRTDSSSPYQDNESSGPSTVYCNGGSRQCYVLNNGAFLVFFPDNTFGAATNSRHVFVDFDPDGAGPYYSISFLLFYNGRIATEGDALSGVGSAWWGSYFGTSTCILCNPSWWRSW